jgi:hypothetical protein
LQFVGIWRLIRPFVLGRRTDFLGLARQVTKVPQAELAVAEAALAGAGPIGEELLAQLRDAAAAFRLVNADGTYELRVSTRGRISFVPRTGWRSNPIPIEALPGNRQLEMQLDIGAQGVIGLLGRTLDGRKWPWTWSPAQGTLESIRARAPWLRLPTPEEQRAARTAAIEQIEAWLGEPGFLGRRRIAINAEPPASEDELRALEVNQHFTLPDAYADLLRRADGVDVGPLSILGTADAYRLDMPGPPRLVISPPDESGAVVLDGDGRVRHVDATQRTSEGRVVGPDLRSWVHRRLTRRERTPRT